ncbi:MAG TPA: mechanosensitive ion channel domain-containing protein [Thermoanaerobaculia bacterium]|nr:mechanosensitive ion channel domain-containing protein [Thermoanaerobaculia bacterium]
MPVDSEWGAAVNRLFTAFLEVLTTYLPQLLGGLLVLLAGALLAWLLRALVVRLSAGLQRWLPLPARRRGVPGHLPALLGSIVFWGVLLLFITAAIHIWGLTIVAEWLARIVAHLPTLAAAGLILVLGVVLGHFVRDLTLSAAASLEYRALLARVAQTSVWAVAAVVALDMIGLDITFIVVLAGIVLGAVAGGVALAFGLGARSFVHDSLAVRDVRARYRMGDEVRVGNLEGRIVEMSARSVILETPEGKLAVPGRFFIEQPCTIIIREETDG